MDLVDGTKGKTWVGGTKGGDPKVHAGKAKPMAHELQSFVVVQASDSRACGMRSDPSRGEPRDGGRERGEAGAVDPLPCLRASSGCHPTTFETCRCVSRQPFSRHRSTRAHDGRSGRQPSSPRPTAVVHVHVGHVHVRVQRLRRRLLIVLCDPVPSEPDPEAWTAWTAIHTRSFVGLWWDRGVLAVVSGEGRDRFASDGCFLFFLSNSSDPGFKIHRLIGRVRRDPSLPLPVEDFTRIQSDSFACDVQTRVEWARWSEHRLDAVARTSMDTRRTRFAMDGLEEGRERSERCVEGTKERMDGATDGRIDETN